jgi:hypothetical protein
MKNLYLLPTDKPSKLYKVKGKYFIDEYPVQSVNAGNQHIYITNDSDIIVKDYVVVSCSEVNIEEVRIVTGYYNEQFLFDDKSQIHIDYCKKIILTTDEDLIQNGVQAIDDKFLEWFVKNQSCEFVEVVSNYRVKSGTIEEHKQGVAGYEYYEYKIIIPSEKPKPIHKFNNGRGATLCVKCYVIISEGITEELHCEKCKLKQETLKEAAENHINNDLDLYESLVDGHISYDIGMDLLNNLFINGAKYMQEKMYSEEDSHKAYCAGSGYNIDCLELEWFENFINK